MALAAAQGQGALGRALATLAPFGKQAGARTG